MSRSSTKRVPRIELTKVGNAIDYLIEDMTNAEAVKLLLETAKRLKERVAREKKRCCK